VTVRTLFTQKINKICFASVFARCKHRPDTEGSNFLCRTIRAGRARFQKSKTGGATLF
jgi:hypothetical protein